MTERNDTTPWKSKIVGHDRVAPDQLMANPFNHRTHPQKQRDALAASIRDVGFIRSVTVNQTTGNLLDGHERVWQALKTEQEFIDVEYVELSEREEKLALATMDGIGEMAATDPEKLEELLHDCSTGEEALQELLAEMADDAGIDFGETGEIVEDEAPIDRAAELQEKWKVKRGDVWEVSGKQSHRIMCGDSTDAANVATLLDGKKVQLIHADPPYGMGKEKDGVANDNLYGDKLDAFQMAWWKAARPHVEDNGSVYIWGNAEDLWRLWYVGGLKDSERLTFRSLIIWDKPPSGLGDGQNNSMMRSFGVKYEACFFFMLGEQGFNNNADNYWEGWDSIVNYLRAEKKKTGWDIAKFKRLAGHSETSGCHWFDKSQWMMPTKEVYEAWQAAARDHDAFKRDHDELKREFYATRAYFDNTHSNMTDVWDFKRVTGEDRHGHATPKPVAMIARAIKSSCPDGGIVYEPFLGSGTTVVAVEETGRKCVAMELEPRFVSVSLERLTALGCECKLTK